MSTTNNAWHRLEAGMSAPTPDVHTVWVGKNFPAWVPQCVESYLHTGHTVHWWLYLHEERQKDLLPLRASGILSHAGLRLCDANTIVPYATAKRMFYLGMGPEGKWKGWAPFSDWFRYEVIARFGGWWVDADSVSVRNLRSLHVTKRISCKSSNPSVELIFCTERHRFDRRTVGAISVRNPHIAKQQARVVDSTISPKTSFRSFRDWVRTVHKKGLQIGLVTNSHFHASGRGLLAIRALADEMHALLEQYVKEVEVRGPESVKELGSNGKALCALPTGNVGMLIFQRKVRQLMEAAGTTASKPRVLHWSVFNPIEATDALRMHRVLGGTEILCGHWVHAVHIFRKIRDEWQSQKMVAPLLAPRVSDQSPLPQERRHKLVVTRKAVLVRELPRPAGPLLKRRRVDSSLDTSNIAVTTCVITVKRRHKIHRRRRRLSLRPLLNEW